MTVFELGRQARSRAAHEVAYREDGAVHLALGGDISEGAQARQVHFHPARGATPATDPVERLGQLRTYGLPIHGLSPGWIQQHGRLPVDSLALYTGGLSGPVEPAALGWRDCLGLGLPYVASLTYCPTDREADLEARLDCLHGATSVVLLPRAVGDRVLRDQATTDGIQDIRFLALARARLPQSVRVRASWAALGFKLAQASLAFGVDELAGWGLEEQLAYGKKGRPAALVGVAEVRAGIEEAGRVPQER